MYGIRRIHLPNPGTWNPFQELERFQAQIGRGGVAASVTNAAPAIDVWSEGEGLRLSALLPGVKPEDLEITIEGDELTIRGTVATSGPRDGDRWLRRERASGTFARTLQLPFAIDADGVKARLANGVLLMELPRSAAEAPRRIAVQDS